MTTTTRDSKGTASDASATAYGPEEGMVQMQIRIPPVLKRALEEEAGRLTDAYGVPVSTSGVLRKLLADGLKRSKEKR